MLAISDFFEETIIDIFHYGFFASLDSSNWFYTLCIFDTIWVIFIHCAIFLGGQQPTIFYAFSPPAQATSRTGGASHIYQLKSKPSLINLKRKHSGLKLDNHFKSKQFDLEK